MSDPLEETISLSDMTEITETEDPRATQYGSTLGTDPSGQANQLEWGKSEPGDTEVRKKTTTLQEKLDAIWTSETPGTGGVRFGPISTTPPGSNPSPPQIPGAPVQNRMCGGSYDQNGGTGQAQYTPQPFNGFNPGQPHGSMQMGATPGWTPMPMPYGAHSMSPQYQVPVYGGQQQMMMPPGQTPFQMAQGDMSMKMMMDQFMQGFIQYAEQQKQNQQQYQQYQQQQQNQQQQTKQSNTKAETVFEWGQEKEQRNERTLDISRVKVSPIDVSTASKAQNSQYLFMGQLEELKIPTSGCTAEQSKQLKQLVDKWGCENEPIITSLRNTFGTSGSGAERLEHVVANFILPMQQQRDVDPEGEVARYNYDKLLQGTGMDFHSELLNFQEKIARLPKGVRADPAYWINRIKEKASDGLLASFERQVREEVKTGNGGAQYDADHEWTAFNRLMSKAIDVQKRRNAKAEPEPKLGPLGFAAHSGPPGLGAGGRQQPGGRPNTGGCVLCDGYKCPHKLDEDSPCDVYSANVTQARCKEIIDDPPYKLYVDTGRKRSNNYPLNYPQPTEMQKAKLREYDQFKENQRAAKGKGGNGRDTQMGRPPATNAHVAPSTEQEKQDMLDQGLEMLQQMRNNFGVE